MARSLVAIFVVLTAVCASGSKPKRVLVVHSFGSVAPPFTTHSIAFETELVEKMGERVDLDEVSLDMARYPDPNLQEALVEYLQKRQAHWQPDLVVPIGSPAGVFVEKYRDRLFPETPILYTGMDRRRLAPDALEKNAAFIGEDFDLPGFIEDILQIAPATKNIAVVIGASPVEQYWAAAFRKEFEPFTNRINFIWLNDLSLDQMLEKTRALPPDSYIFLILLLRDATGVTHNADEALQRIHAVANAPINSIFQHQLGLGIVGGRLYQAELEGIESARTAVRILHGEPASSFPPKIVGPLSPRYDWRELVRWKIDQKRLPSGSTILFRSPSIWQQHRGWIIAGVSVCLGQALLIAALVANLFRRRRAEHSLTESEQRFRNAADAAPVLMWMSGADKLCTFVNKEWLNFTGCAMEQELGAGWADGLHEDDRENFVQRYHAAFDAREPFAGQYRLRRHDGEFRWVTDSGVPRYDGQGNFLGYVGACIDISDLLKKEEALHESEERIALAAEAAHLGVWELNLATNELWVSDQWRSLFQIKPGVPVTADDVSERIHPDDRDRRLAAIQKAIEENSGYEIEYRALLPDKTVRWMAGRARCISDGDRRSTRLLGVSMDITERRRGEKEAMEQRDELLHLSRVASLGQLSGSLAHELNQPLGIILSNAQAAQHMLAGDAPDILELREILADIVGENLRAGEVITRLRALLKRGETRLLPLALNEVIEDVLRLLRSDLVARGVTVRTTLAEGLPDVPGDEVQLQQVLLNIITNACDAMVENPPKERILRISTNQQSGGVHVSMADQGRGLPGGDVSQIFQPFFTTKTHGLGIGLSICQSIIAAHHGRLWAEANEGSGTTLHLEFQIVAPTAS